MLFRNWLKAVLLGLVEGVTEWLPISSTGHLILVEEWLYLPLSDAFRELFDVVIQGGAVLAVALWHLREQNPFSARKSPREKQKIFRLWRLCILAVLPSAAAGLWLDDLIGERFYSPISVACMLILWGFGFFWIEKFRASRPPRIFSPSEMTATDALGVGVMQIFSLFPGTSRSGATVVGGMLFGLSRDASARFSFLLAIPTVLGASAFKAFKYFLSGNRPSGNEWGLLAVGFGTAFGISLAVIRFLTGYLRTHRLNGFGLYRILLGSLVLLSYFMKK